MSTQSEAARRESAPLDGRIPRGASADQVADLIVVNWLEIDQALHPIIGHRGVAALYHRSMTLASVDHPWMAIGHAGLLAVVDTVALRAALVQQTSASATAGGNALFQTFRGLLASLVGPALAERMLLPVWPPSSAESTARDRTP